MSVAGISTTRGSITAAKVLHQALKRYAPRVAIKLGDRAYTYRELDVESGRLATGFKTRGLDEGDKVGLLLNNSVEYVIAHLAILKCNAVLVPMNKLLSGSDITYISRHAKLKFLVVDDDLIDSIGLDVSATLVLTGNLTPDRDFVRWAELLNGPDLEDYDFNCLDEPGMIMYTGGTTGQPKGVLHTQRALGFNLVAHIISLQILSETRLLLTSPLAHSAGFLAMSCLSQGGIVVLRESFDPDELLEMVPTEKINMLFLVPTMIYRLLDAMERKNQVLDSLDTIVYGAAPIDPGRLKQGLELLGPVFLQIYAQTECPNIATTLSKADHLIPEYLRSCGQPTSSTEVRVVDRESQEECRRGNVGEVEFRSPFTMSEYYLDAEKTRETYHEGWLKTGDLGYQLDSGHLFLVDREKDMIISGGLNVYSTEVERILSMHPGIREVAVIGVPHEDWGEAVHAVIVPTADDLPSIEDIKAFCRADLAAYKMPKSVSPIEALPLTAYGKIDKKKLRSSFWDGKERLIN